MTIHTNLKDPLASIRTESVGDHVPFVRVLGMDLRSICSLPDKETRQAATAIFRRLMQTHGVLVFPDQILSPEQEVAANEIFGYHDTANPFSQSSGFAATTGVHDGRIPSCPAVQLQGNILVENHHGVENLQLRSVLGWKEEGFHSDAVHDQKDFDDGSICVLTSMYALKTCEKGGETYFACTREPLKAISAERMAFLRRLRVHYLNGKWMTLRGRAVMKDAIRRLGRENDSALVEEARARGETLDLEFLDSPAAAENGPVHPLIRKHPETGEESIWTSTANICYIEAPAVVTVVDSAVVDSDGGAVGTVKEVEPVVFLDCAQSYDLIEELLGNGCSEEECYAHFWKPNDFVIWDNRITLHSAPKLQNLEGERFSHRVRLTGSAEANADCVGVWEDVKRGREAQGLTPSAQASSK